MGSVGRLETRSCVLPRRRVVPEPRHRGSAAPAAWFPREEGPLFFVGYPRVVGEIAVNPTEDFRFCDDELAPARRARGSQLTALDRPPNGLVRCVAEFARYLYRRKPFLVEKAAW